MGTIYIHVLGDGNTSDSVVSFSGPGRKVLATTDGGYVTVEYLPLGCSNLEDCLNKKRFMELSIPEKALSQKEVLQKFVNDKQKKKAKWGRR